MFRPRFAGWWFIASRPGRVAGARPRNRDRLDPLRFAPGILVAAGLSFLADDLATIIGIDLMGLPRSPISPVMMAIVLGVLVRNTIGLSPAFEPGVRFCLVRVLRLGIVLLGIRLSLGQVGVIGIRSLPIIIGSVAAALLIVTSISVGAGLTPRLGTLIAVGTSVCGATAIVATAPAVGARDDEVSYSVACITVTGVIAMLVYPFEAHWWFAADPFRSGLFLGAAVHETAQVVGSGLVYQEYFGDAAALDAATVTKLVRNLGMLVIIPLMSMVYHRRAGSGHAAPRWWSMIPLFVVGFAGMSLLRTVGDMADPAFGFLAVERWGSIVGLTKHLAEICLAIAMAVVGLGTSMAGIRKIGFRPLAVGILSAMLVGAVSVTLIGLLYGRRFLTDSTAPETVGSNLPCRCEHRYNSRRRDNMSPASWSVEAGINGGEPDTRWTMQSLPAAGRNSSVS